MDRRRRKIPQASHFAGQRMPRRKGPALARSACRELAVDGLEARKGRAMARELERQPAPALDDAGRHVHEFLHHGPEASAFRLVPDRRILAEEADEPDPAQNVVGERRARHDEVVGGELARRQALDVEVGLELGMELLAGGMIAIERDHLLVRTLDLGQRRPPALDRDLGHEQALPMPVDRALGHANDAAEGAGVAAERLLDLLREDADALALAREAPLGVLLRALEPGLEILLARVPFDDEINAFGREPGAALGRIVAGIEPTEEPVPREALGARHDPLEKID